MTFSRLVLHSQLQERVQHTTTIHTLLNVVCTVKIHTNTVVIIKATKYANRVILINRNMCNYNNYTMLTKNI